jgi:hypothetical protein
MSHAELSEVDGSGESLSAVARLDAIRLRLVESIDTEPAGDRAAGIARGATAAVAALGDIDLSQLDAIEMRTWLVDIEQLRRSVEATAIAAAGAIDRHNPFRSQGFFSAKTAVKHMCKLSGPEAHRRVQTARLHHALPAWARAESDGDVGVAQSELMARIAANPRIASAVLERHIRRVVLDSSGTIIDLGRRSRHFRGAAREAVMLLTTTCIWIGCDRPTTWCDADHSLGWNAHGNTVPRNGQPLCHAHNNLKEHGYHVHRDNHGNWHITDPDSHEIS